MKKIVYHVIVVGCGGTGGFFIKEFGRFMARSKENILLTLIDGDIVEEHNLDRQSFQEEDIGVAKSSVFSSALVSCFGLPDERVLSFPTYIDFSAQLSKICRQSINSYLGSSYYYSKVVPVLIGAVDNHPARIALHEYYMNDIENGFYFDSANEFSSGEVVFSGKREGKLLAPPRGIIFPEVLKSTEKKRSERSCSVANVHEPQHIATNMLAANFLLAKTTQLITEKKVKLGVAMFNVFECASQFYPALIDEKEETNVATSGKKRGRKAKKSA